MERFSGASPSGPDMMIEGHDFGRSAMDKHLSVDSRAHSAKDAGDDVFYVGPRSTLGLHPDLSPDGRSAPALHRQHQSYGSADFSSSTSEPVTPPDHRFAVDAAVSSSAFDHSLPYSAYNYLSVSHASAKDPGPHAPGSRPFQPQQQLPAHQPFTGYQQYQQYGLNAPAVDGPRGLPMPLKGLRPGQAGALASSGAFLQQPFAITPPGEASFHLHRSALSTGSISEEDALLHDLSRMHLQPSPGSMPSNMDLAGPATSPGRFDGDRPELLGHRRQSSFLQARITDDKFPILVRRASNGFSQPKPAQTSAPTMPQGRLSVSGGLFEFLDSPFAPDQTPSSGSWASPKAVYGNNTTNEGLPFMTPQQHSMKQNDQQTPRYTPPLQSPQFTSPYIAEAEPTSVDPMQFGPNLRVTPPSQAHPAPAMPMGQPAQPVRVDSGHSNGRRQSKRSDYDSNKYAMVKLENVRDDIYPLCKDQHGCRFLQRKLDDRNPEYLDMIFNETYPHVVELMTDPFGNYLCQKLLEYTTDKQRTVLVRTAAPELVKIALNQHGTRALQKMIQYVTTTEQIDMIIAALSTNVVLLIKDLNGNHVIQKCLNKLSSEQSQFIFDAVCGNCVTVGTHKHGCCVLQRCIDHASPSQKRQIVREITANTIALVQDQFGNYVTQYVLDLGIKEFSEPLILQFVGKTCRLSVQKFSSNVIEKCLRIAESNTASLLIEELVESPDLAQLLRDSYANYVIQTALDFAQPELRQRLVNNIKPIMPSIRSTAHGRRIQLKLVAQGCSTFSGSSTPGDYDTSVQYNMTSTM